MTATTIPEIDYDAHYTVAGWSPGIAFYLAGPEMVDEYDEETGENVTEWTGYQIPTGNVLAVMVGDDLVHVVDPADLTPLDDLDYCHVCGQVGCTHDGLDRTEER